MNEDARLTDLEIRSTHQESTLQALNDVVAEQQQLITQLRKELEAMKARLSELSSSNVAAPWEETPPPHYCAGGASSGSGTSRPSNLFLAATPNRRNPRSASGGWPATQTLGLPCATPMMSGRPARATAPRRPPAPPARAPDRTRTRARPPRRHRRPPAPRRRPPPAPPHAR